VSTGRKFGWEWHRRGRTEGGGPSLAGRRGRVVFAAAVSGKQFVNGPFGGGVSVCGAWTKCVYVLMMMIKLMLMLVVLMIDA
jgi:hypothetical protein